jgi:hypothetical protein
MVCTEQDLAAGQIVTPKRGLMYANWDNRAAAKVPTPIVQANSMPPSVSPPNSPLLMYGLHRSLENEASTRGSARV